MSPRDLVSDTKKLFVKKGSNRSRMSSKPKKNFGSLGQNDPQDLVSNLPIIAETKSLRVILACWSQKIFPLQNSFYGILSTFRRKKNFWPLNNLDLDLALKATVGFRNFWVFSHWLTSLSMRKVVSSLSEFFRILPNTVGCTVTSALKN